MTNIIGIHGVNHSDIPKENGQYALIVSDSAVTRTLDDGGKQVTSGHQKLFFGNNYMLVGAGCYHNIRHIGEEFSTNQNLTLDMVTQAILEIDTPNPDSRTIFIAAGENRHGELKTRHIDYTKKDFQDSPIQYDGCAKDEVDLYLMNNRHRNDMDPSNNLKNGFGLVSEIAYVAAQQPSVNFRLQYGLLFKTEKGVERQIYFPGETSLEKDLKMHYEAAMGSDVTDLSKRYEDVAQAMGTLIEKRMPVFSFITFNRDGVHSTI